MYHLRVTFAQFSNNLIVVSHSFLDVIFYIFQFGITLTHSLVSVLCKFRIFLLYVPFFSRSGFLLRLVISIRLLVIGLLPIYTLCLLYIPYTFSYVNKLIQFKGFYLSTWYCSSKKSHLHIKKKI